VSDDADAANDAGDAAGALDPDELGPDDEHVHPLGDGRFLVSTDPPPESSPDPDGASAGADASPEGARGADAARATPDETSTRTELSDLPGAYALAIRARTEGTEESLRVASDDVSESFEALVRWYAGRVAPDVPPEEALAVLLADADLDVRLDAAVRSESGSGSGSGSESESGSGSGSGSNAE
jgi:hypothetical protein